MIERKFKTQNPIPSRLLVTEVRRRASNQSTEAAASAIATFMEVDVSGGGNGWHLLSTLSLLVAEGDALAEARFSTFYLGVGGHPRIRRIHRLGGLF